MSIKYRRAFHFYLFVSIDSHVLRLKCIKSILAIMVMWVSKIIQTDDFPHSQHVGCRTLTVLAWMEQKRCYLQEHYKKHTFTQITPYDKVPWHVGFIGTWIFLYMTSQAKSKTIKNVVIPFIFRLNESGNTPLHASAPPLACWDRSDGFEYRTFKKTLAFLSKRLKTKARLLVTCFGLKTLLSELILENEHVCISDFSNVKRW